MITSVASILKVLSELLGYIALALAGSAVSGCSVIPIFNF